MGLSWQQGPLSPAAIGRFLVPEPLPKRLLYVEPLRRRMRVRFGGTWIADSENVLAALRTRPLSDGLLPGDRRLSRHSTTYRAHHPAPRPRDYSPGMPSGRGSKSAPRGAWQHIDLPAYASELKARVAFAWPAMDAFYEEDERIMGHAADSYHRIDIRQRLP